MNRISVTPDDKSHWLKLRSANINSTDISCLFDLNPYQTKFELWHKLKNPEDQLLIKQSERMDWGNALESAIATEAARRMSWNASPFKDYVTLEGLRIGSSFDFRIAPPLNALLEVKNVDSLAYSKNWTEYDQSGDFTEGEMPAHIEIQVQHQMLVSGLELAFVCALVGGNTLKIFKREANKELHTIMLKKSSEFWASVDSNNPPQIDYQRDAEFVIKLNSFAEPNKTMQADEKLDDLVKQYNATSQSIRNLESVKDSWKAQILEYIKDAEKVKGENYTISAGITPEAQISFTRKPFRNFKITNKRTKQEDNNV